MKAVVYTEYGSPEVLHLAEVDKPLPKNDEVLIKIRATSVGFGDIMARNFRAVTPREFYMPFLFWVIAQIAFGPRKPKTPILGAQFSGEIEAVGSDVTRFKVGDQVFAYLGSRMGANAEYICMAENEMLGIKPGNISYAEAAVMPYGMLTALPILEKAGLRPGQSILINGASGGIGAAAVQLARHHFGAQVTGVCGTRRVDYVKALGADHVIDYQKADFTQNGETYDVIFDVLGKRSFSAVKGSLAPEGIYLLSSFKEKKLLQMLWTSMTGGKQVICALATEKAENLALIKDLIESGKLKAIVDRTFPLEDIAAAHRYIEAGDHQGPVAISVA